MFFPIQGDVDYANVLARLPMDGAHNATSFPDISPVPKTVTRTGSAIISTALGFPAAYLPDSYLTIASHADFAVGTGDYTLSFRCQFTTISTNYVLVDFRPSASNGYYPCVVVSSAGQLQFYWNASERIVSSAGAIIVGVSYHIAVCRSGSSTRMFINGVQVGSTYSNASSIPQSAVLIGGTTFYGASFHNYLWDFQYLRVALYTANFTPPASKSLLGYGSNKYFRKQPHSQPSFLQAARLGL